MNNSLSEVLYEAPHALTNLSSISWMSDITGHCGLSCLLQLTVIFSQDGWCMRCHIYILSLPVVPFFFILLNSLPLPVGSPGKSMRCERCDVFYNNKLYVCTQSNLIG